MIYDTPFILRILSFLFFLYYLSMRVRLCARTHAHCLHVYNKVKYQEKYDKAFDEFYKKFGFLGEGLATEEEKEKLLHSAETIKENTRKGLEHA